MRRWHEDLHVTRAHWREHLKIVHDWPRKPLDCECELQVGRFRKIGGHGCHKARCLLCHRHKIFREPTRQEIVTAIALREQVYELGG